MRQIAAVTDTDAAWEAWGRLDPYFGVITNPRFRRTNMTDKERQEFFESGRLHVEHVLGTVRAQLGPSFHPASILDFGCGVGRTLVHFAKVAPQVVGVDVSSSMLREARCNCDKEGLDNVQLLLADDGLTSLSGRFALVHSFIVFQHIPVDRGRTLLRRLLSSLAPGGVGALHFLYSKAIYANTHGAPPAPTTESIRNHIPAQPAVDPEIQMNPYNLNELFFLFQEHNIHRLNVELTDHGGEFGLFAYFRVP